MIPEIPLPVARPFSLLLSGLLLFGCGAQRSDLKAAQEAPASAPRDSDDSTGAASPPPSPGQSESESPSRAEEDREMAAPEGESAPAEERSPAADAAGAAPAFEAKKDKKLEQEELSSLMVDFRNHLAPEHLSCSGARPLRETICGLATRICESSDPSSLNAKQQCAEAKKSCEEAKSSYRSKCGSD